MNYQEFFGRFMGACRRKHLPYEPEVVDRIKNRLKPSRKGAPNPNRGGRYWIPDESELPKEFIRLEPWEIEYLYPMANRARHGILETGRFRGGSTFLFACANATVPIHSVDIAPQDDDKLKELLEKAGIGKNVNLIVGDSQHTQHPSVGDIDVLFIDGDHSYDGCTNDLENWFPKVVNGGHILLHDCYFGCEVQDSVIDFLEKNRAQVEAVQGPYIPASHWRMPSGSLAHLIKRSH